MIQYLLLILRVATEGLAGFSRKNGLNLRPDRMQRKFRGKTRSYKEITHPRKFAAESPAGPGDGGFRNISQTNGKVLLGLASGTT